MRFFVTFSLVLCLAVPIFAETFLRDVPEGHYAYEAVYDLVRQGITGGFPDGTYRGKKKMSRYEIASFISKFMQSKNLSRGANEKMIEELKAEVALVQYDKNQAEKETKFEGELAARWRAGRTADQQGAKADYRLKSVMIKNFNDAAWLRVDLDTLDTGGNGGNRDLVRDLLAIEGTVKLGRSELRLTSGPGDLSHVDDGLFPSENNAVYQRPWRAAYFSTEFDRTNLSLALISRSNFSTGSVEVYELSPAWAQAFNPVRLTLQPRFFYDVEGQRDSRLELGGEFTLNQIFRGSLLAGYAWQTDYPHNLFMRGECLLGDNFRLLAQKIGSRYRESFTYNILDIFGRNVADGSTSVGSDIRFAWGPIFVGARADLASPAEVLTKEFRLGTFFNPATSLAGFYQSYNAAQALGAEINIRY